MTFESGFILLGILLIAVAVVASFLRRLPLSETMIYLGAGLLIGPAGLGVIFLDARQHADVLHRLAEIAVLVSLFTTGLKLRGSLRERRWRIPIRLAFVSMIVTVGLIAATAMLVFQVPIGIAILLGGLLAPTDPVLASEVQLQAPQDRDRLRFSLTAEAGLNDGTAFPFVLLGLALCGLEAGNTGLRWVLQDVLWAVGGGLGIGALLGRFTALLVLWLRRKHKEAVGRDEFIALGLIALSYGAAVGLHTYGFLAVFAAGLALRAVEREHSGGKAPQEVLAAGSGADSAEIATDPKTASAHMARAVLTFNEQLDRIVEVCVVLLVGLAFVPSGVEWRHLAFVAALFFVIRPLSVAAGLWGAEVTTGERGLIAWFGIRGIGSLYYLMFAISQGLPKEHADWITQLTLLIVATSIIVHGITVTPLMARYQAKRRARNPAGLA